MQTATGYVVLSPENKQLHRGITPAQALILRKLHFSNSQGNPLEGLVIDGEAMEKKPDGNLRPLEEIEADVIRLAIGHYRGRMTEVARRLGIGRSTLYRKLSDLGIDNAA